MIQFSTYDTILKYFDYLLHPASLHTNQGMLLLIRTLILANLYK